MVKYILEVIFLFFLKIVLEPLRMETWNQGEGFKFLFQKHQIKHMENEHEVSSSIPLLYTKHLLRSGSYLHFLIKGEKNIERDPVWSLFWVVGLWFWQLVVLLFTQWTIIVACFVSFNFFKNNIWNF